MIDLAFLLNAMNVPYIIQILDEYGVGMIANCDNYARAIPDIKQNRNEEYNKKKKRLYNIKEKEKEDKKNNKRKFRIIRNGM